MRLTKSYLSAMLLPLVSACSTTPVQPEVINDFPTLTRVEYVLQCMQKRGGQKYDTLYPCVCMADEVAAQMNHKEFEEARTFTYLRSLPGEAGGAFRDPPEAKRLRKRLEEVEALADKKCFVK